MAWISGLSDLGRELYHYLVRGIYEGKSGTEILSGLRELGRGYRLTDFYSDLRILKGETLKWDTMKYVREEYTISDRLYTPAVYTAKYPYITRFEVTLQDPETGELYTAHTSVGHEVTMRRADLEALAEENIAKRQELYHELEGFEIIHIKPVGGFKRV